MQKTFLSNFVVVAASFALIGCPADLRNAEAFTSTPQCESMDINADVTQLFATSCAGVGCHGSTDSAAQLDLVSDGIAARMLGVNAKGVGCEARQLIVPNDADASYLLAKVRGDVDICGDRMPFGRALDPRLIDCIRQWIELNDAGGASPGDGGMP